MIINMAQVITDKYVKFGEYMKNSPYAKKFIEEYLTNEGGSVDVAFQKFAKENAAAFTQEGIMVLHDIITMMKDNDIKDFIFEYAKSHKKTSTTSIKQFTEDELVSVNGQDNVYLHTPSKIIVKKESDLYVAIGYVPDGSVDAAPLTH